MAVVQRHPGTKQGLVSRMFDGESAPASKQVVRKKVGKVKNAKQPRDPGRKQEKT